jgi:hypothetical protein
MHDTALGLRADLADAQGAGRRPRPHARHLRARSARGLQSRSSRPTPRSRPRARSRRSPTSSAGPRCSGAAASSTATRALARDRPARDHQSRPATAERLLRLRLRAARLGPVPRQHRLSFWLRGTASSRPTSATCRRRERSAASAPARRCTGSTPNAISRSCCSRPACSRVAQPRPLPAALRPRANRRHRPDPGHPHCALRVVRYP